MSFLSQNFVVPEGLVKSHFRLRPIRIHDVARDYEAVMTNREYLWTLFGDCWGWPSEDLTFEQDLIDLAWHQKESQLRRAFNYVVLDADEQRLLGCVYIDPSQKKEYDAEAYLWLRQDGVEATLEELLLADVRSWLADAWPFSNVAFPGRDISWQEWNALPDRPV